MFNVYYIYLFSSVKILLIIFIYNFKGKIFEYLLAISP
ncbi:hypothetical protein MuYL_2900 [Mucilaginibacter xinganensis]|uniref:Uncharacterized protein n=1 Tax=Mucilaginibacter xinganensis TaxID=1234841 RepID=A0A223NY42_9SPHI|nr:hypothetical protein MuYL_2900 [Mucilaginibacter xinganensis]